MSLHNIKPHLEVTIRVNVRHAVQNVPFADQCRDPRTELSLSVFGGAHEYASHSRVYREICQNAAYLAQFVAVCCSD